MSHSRNSGTPLATLQPSELQFNQRESNHIKCFCECSGIDCVHNWLLIIFVWLLKMLMISDNTKKAKKNLTDVT